MKLHDIIRINDETSHAILVEKILPYRKSLTEYYKDKFSCNPMLMIVMVSNAAQYARIVPENEFMDAVNKYLDADGMPIDDPERESAAETIAFNSIPLKNL